MTNLLDTSDVAVDDNTEVKFEDLVGEGKKFRDQDAVAKKIVHSDAHIARVEREAAEMRETIAKLQAQVQANDRLSTIEDLLRKGEPSVTPPANNAEAVITAPTLDETAILKILEKKTLNDRKSEN